VRPLRLPTRGALARFGAPAAFLAGVTLAVLLVRAGLGEADEPGTTVIPTLTTATTAPTTTATTDQTTTREEQPRFYTIERGDTFGTVAEEFDTTVERLIELNPGVDSTSLRIGQRIRVE
jgi:LysM repeat protein